MWGQSEKDQFTFLCKPVLSNKMITLDFKNSGFQLALCMNYRI
ncbi:hypothetical protein RV03_GL000852 [Enterococcus gallinarum]|nr:hypothetical protein RV03_GL000852 [Enterococcus gallinarum]